MKTGDKRLFRFRGKFIPVKIISILDYGIECEFLADFPPVKAGEKVICGTANLFKEGEHEK